jgi:hypothetical protein
MKNPNKIMPINFKKILSSALIWVAASLSAAEITYEKLDATEGGYKIFLRGKIEKKDVHELSKILDNASKKSNKYNDNPMEKMIILDSPGGNVESAIAMGIIIRRTKMLALVPEISKCFSSCVYLLSAGVIKWPIGEVGIHRPYFESRPSMGYDQALKLVLNSSRKYFGEMNIPEQLADDMFSIHPSEIKLLNSFYLSKYRLNQDDMAYSEGRAIENARQYGVTRQEYEKRLKLSEIYAKQCRESQIIELEENPTLAVIRCGEFGYKKAGLILK